MGTFVTQTARGELAPRKRGKRAHISPVCHPCGSGAWSQLGWPQNWWARETASPSGPTVGQIFMWAVKYILPHILKNTLPGGSLQKYVAVLSGFNKTFLSISESGGRFLSLPFNSHANFSSCLFHPLWKLSSLQQISYRCGQTSALKHQRTWWSQREGSKFGSRRGGGGLLSGSAYPMVNTPCEVSFR